MMAEFVEGLTFKVGDGAGTEVFTEMALFEVPELLAAEKALLPNRTTADAGNTKKYRLGFEDGETLAIKVKMDFENAEQDILRAAKTSGDEVNCQIIISDGTVTETYTAPYLVTSAPITDADPNGDGEVTFQTFNIKRNADNVLVVS